MRVLGGPSGKEKGRGKEEQRENKATFGAPGACLGRKLKMWKRGFRPVMV